MLVSILVVDCAMIYVLILAYSLGRTTRVCSDMVCFHAALGAAELA